MSVVSDNFPISDPEDLDALARELETGEEESAATVPDDLDLADESEAVATKATSLDELAEQMGAVAVDPETEIAEAGLAWVSPKPEQEEMAEPPGVLVDPEVVEEVAAQPPEPEAPVEPSEPEAAAEAAVEPLGLESEPPDPEAERQVEEAQGEVEEPKDDSEDLTRPTR